MMNPECMDGSLSVVWFRGPKAKIIRISEERMERAELQSRDEGSVFEDLVQHLVNVQRLLILAPGGSSERFVEFLEDKHRDIARKVIGCESVDLPSDQQIASVALRHFQERKVI